MNATTARSALAHAFLLGLAADLLLREGPSGIGFPIWVAAVGLSTAALVGQVERILPRESRAWLAMALLCAAGVVWRSSETLLALDVLGTGLCLAMAGVALRDPDWTLFRARLRDVMWALLRIARTTAIGVLPVALRARLDAHSTANGYDYRAVARAVAFSTVLLVVFGSLLLSADPIFASLVSIPDFNVEVALSHLVIVGVFTWIVGGWTRGALDVSGRATPPERFGFSLGALDVTLGLGVLNVLFAAYVGAQLAWLFGGDAYLQARTGLTASAYARRGFFEMVWVALLCVPLLLGTRALLAPVPGARRRHKLLSLPLVALVGAMIVSAVLRMRLYVAYFGLTEERFYPLIFMGWLAIVLALVTITLVREESRTFVAGVVLSGFATLASLHVVNPDTFIARVNIARSATTSSRDAATLDLTHLATLGGEATGLAATAVVSTTSADPAERCVAARRLLSRWGPASPRALRRAEPGGWRAWNLGEQRGLAAVAESAPALQGVIEGTCAPAPAAEPR